MPIHAPSTSLADLCSVFMAVMWFRLPGIDRRALYEWALRQFPSDGFARQWGLFLLMRAVEWAIIAVFTLFYRMRWRFIEQYKVFPAVPWPWYSPKPEVRDAYRALERQALLYAVKVNVFWLVVTWLTPQPSEPLDPAVWSGESLPEWYVSAGMTAVAFLVMDFFNYAGHWAMHRPLLYRWHKKHHEYKGDASATTILSAMYLSPMDFLISEIVPTMLGVIAAELTFARRMHAFTVVTFIVPATFTSLAIHSGYSFPLSPLRLLPFNTEIEAYHDLHHRHPVVNYGGILLIWDHVFGTLRLPSEMGSGEKGE
jgi:sterol desaturase/sphingolipid hydroxylase (fatty acid hydroxylase superfamily)